MEANVILIQCGKAKKPFGVRAQLMEDGDWWRTWAFKIDSHRAKSEGYDNNNVVGNLYPTKEYPGCPYCESYSIVQCGNCQKLSCWNGERSMKCGWCEEQMTKIITAETKLNISGTQF